MSVDYIQQHVYMNTCAWQNKNTKITTYENIQICLGSHLGKMLNNPCLLAGYLFVYAACPIHACRQDHKLLHLFPLFLSFWSFFLSIASASSGIYIIISSQSAYRDTLRSYVVTLDFYA